MYNFVFWYIYSRDKAKGEPEWLCRFDSSGVVLFTICFHALFILQSFRSLGKYSVDLSFLPESRAIGMICFVLFIIFVSLFYTKSRIKKIEGKYGEKNRGSFAVKFFFFLIVFLPLLLFLTLIVIG